LVQPNTLRRWRVAAILVTLWILVLLLLPASSLPSTAVAVPDKVAHGALFLLWAFTWRRSGLRPGHVVLLGLVLAMATEAGQGLLHLGRQAEVADAVADLVGVLLGLGLARVTTAR
jgi:VanZ family protein